MIKRKHLLCVICWEQALGIKLVDKVYDRSLGENWEQELKGEDN